MRLHGQGAKNRVSDWLSVYPSVLVILLAEVGILKATSSISHTDWHGSLAADGCGPEPGAGTLTQVNARHKALGAQPIGFFGYAQSSLHALCSKFYQLIHGWLLSSSNFWQVFRNLMNNYHAIVHFIPWNAKKHEWLIQAPSSLRQRLILLTRSNETLGDFLGTVLVRVLQGN